MGSRDIKLFLGIFIIFIVCTGLISAYSVSTPYHKNKPLEMYPGQEREVVFNLQNCPSLADSCEKKDVKIGLTLEKGGEIASIVSGKEYNIPYGSSNTNIKMRIKVPQNTAVGSEYLIRFSLNSVPENSAGALQLGLNYNVEFPVIIKDSSEVPTTPEVYYAAEGSRTTALIILTIIILLLIIIIIIVVLMLYKTLKKRKQI